MDIPFLLAPDDTPLNPVKLLDVQLRANDQGTLITLVFDQLIMLTGERIVYALCGEEWRAASYAGRRNDSRSYDFQLDAASPSSILRIALSEKADIVSGNGMLYHFDRASGTLLWQYYNRPYISLKGSGAV